MQARYILPVIPKPKPGTAPVISFTGDGAITGDGPIDLHCGSCSFPIATGQNEGQIQNIVLKCPKCEAHNAVVNIPSIKHFITQLQATNHPPQSIPKFKKLIKKALDGGEKEREELSEQIVQVVPEFSWFQQYLAPSNAGELYAFLAFVLAFITWYQNHFGSKKETPSTVINNYYSNNDPYKKVSRNDPCPCGSGKKFKKCHGLSSK